MPNTDLLGILAGIIGAGFATLLSFAAAKYLFDIDWEFDASLTDFRHFDNRRARDDRRRGGEFRCAFQKTAGYLAFPIDVRMLVTNKGNHNKVKLTKQFITYFSMLFLSAIAANAQQLNKADVSLETLKVKKEFSIKSQKQLATGEKRLLDVGFNTKRFPVNGPASQTNYVRPTKKERFDRYASDAFGVPALIGATFGATVSQIGNNPPEWKKTAGGFGRRFASSYGTNAIRNTVSYGISEAFKLDNRFERSGEKDFGKRLKHAFLGSYTTRTKNGNRVPDFPYVIGTYSASVIANETWYPKRFSYQDGLRDGTISLGVRFGVNLLREFVFPK